MNKNIQISAILVVKNEEVKLEECLKSISWVDEIILVDNESSDNTVKIAKKYKCKIFTYKGGFFSERKNFAADKANGEWLLFVDADERVSPSLKQELISNLKIQGSNVYAIPRRNMILGREFKFSGQNPDYVIRFIKKDNLIAWIGDLHEQPKYKGELSYMISPLDHIKHDNLHDMVTKTNKWSNIEAELMVKSNHPPMNIYRFTSAVLREFYLRFIKEKAYLDGIEGIIYGIYQIFSRFLSYAKLWEIQINTKNQNLIATNYIHEKSSNL